MYITELSGHSIHQKFLIPIYWEALSILNYRRNIFVIPRENHELVAIYFDEWCDRLQKIMSSFVWHFYTNFGFRLLPTLTFHHLIFLSSRTKTCINTFQNLSLWYVIQFLWEAHHWNQWECHGGKQIQIMLQAGDSQKFWGRGNLMFCSLIFSSFSLKVPISIHPSTFPSFLPSTCHSTFISPPSSVFPTPSSLPWGSCAQFWPLGWAQLQGRGLARTCSSF